MQAAGLTRLGDLGGLAGFGNRRGPCQKTTGFIDRTGAQAEIRRSRSFKENPDAARRGKLEVVNGLQHKQ